MTQKTEPSLLTIAELSRSLSLPESTTRYYCNRFAAHLPSVGEGRRRRYKPEALEKLRTIAETMRRDKNAYAVDLALRNEANGGVAVAIPATMMDASLAVPTRAFAAQVLSLMENQTRALQDIAGAMGIFAKKLSVTLPAEAVQAAQEAAPVFARAPREVPEELREEISMLREQIRTAESVHQNDLEQLRKWLTRLGEALAGK
jgi:DNA-binding transcriptional MerR regulator